ncbi:hypothetical protein [Streptomyces sp. NPDC059928]|uniref:hypothetical protein n=1 Tax=Streptomyces sp. NPDC059928 TaxID=3347007 RepID=UPI003659BA57
MSTRSTRFRAAAALGAAALLVTGCSKGSDSGALSVAGMKDRAKAMGTAGAEVPGEVRHRRGGQGRGIRRPGGFEPRRARRDG